MSALRDLIRAMGYVIDAERSDARGRVFVMVSHEAFPGWCSAWRTLTPSNVEHLAAELTLYAGRAVALTSADLRAAARVDTLRRELEALDRRRAEIVAALDDPAAA